MLLRNRKKPRFIRAGTGNVVVSTTKCAISALLASEGAAASAVFYDATGTVNATLDIRHLLVCPSGETVGDLLATLEFGTGCVVSCQGGVGAGLTIGLVSLEGEQSQLS
jgi:hypothetical protein